MAEAKRDNNRVPTLLGVDSVGFTLPTTVGVNATTHAMLVEASVSISGTPILDGVDSNIKATVFDYANSNPLGVVLRDSNGDYVSAGGGTQYATNAAYVDGNLGTLALSIRDDALTTLTEADGDYSGLRVTSVGRLWASVVLDTAIPAGNNNIGDVDAIQSGTWNITNISGTITLPTGASTLAEQQTQTASLSVLDDWDETDRAKVNIIVGQAGIAAGTGTDGAAVPRVTLATNVPLPAGTNAIGKLSANTGVTIGAVEIAAAQTLATVTTVGTVTTLTGTTSLTPGTAAANLGKAEDAGHTTGDVGVMALGVRNDAGTALATTTLDYIPFTTDEVGAQWMATIGRISTANSTTANLANAAVFTGTSEEVKNYAAIQVSVFSSHASATDGLSLQQSSDGTNWDITDTYTISATTSKVISVQPAARYFRLVYTNGGTLTTSLRIQTVYHTEAPNPSSQRPADAYTNETDLTQLWAFNSLYNGTTWDRMRGDTTNGLDVDVTRLPALVAGSAIIGNVRIDQTTPGTTNAVSLAQLGTTTIATDNGASSAGTQRVTIANNSTGILAGVTTVTTLTGTTTLTPGTGAANLGKAEDAVAGAGDTGVFALGVANEAQTTLAADADYIAQATDTKGNRLVVGNIAHDTADAGNPVKVGGKAVSAEPAVVTANDRANFISDLVGKQIVAPYTNPENIVSGAITTAMTATTSTSLLAAPASGLRNYITTIIVSNSHATVGTDIVIQDGSGGTTLMTIPAGAVYGGAVISLPVPLRQPTTATAIFCANVTTGASTKVSAVGYKGV